MTEIYVDADACPVKEEVLRVAGRHGLVTYLVSNGGIRPSRDPLVRTVVVPEGPDVADDWIAERAGPGDLCVTNDIPLAARCLDRGAIVLRPNGERFTPENIGMRLAVRDIHASLRETPGVQTYNAPFGARERSSFLNRLEPAVREAKRLASD